jgi:hypothetical protein
VLDVRHNVAMALASPLPQDLQTPCLVVDRDVLEANLVAMADRARDHSFTLRPHAKTHKCFEIARRQLALGAVGLTVATVGEARFSLTRASPTCSSPTQCGPPECVPPGCARWPSRSICWLVSTPPKE